MAVEEKEIFCKSCPKNIVLIKTKNNTFLTFLDKMQVFAILCFVTYDWFCADGSHMTYSNYLQQN